MDREQVIKDIRDKYVGKPLKVVMYEYVLSPPEDTTNFSFVGTRSEVEYVKDNLGLFCYWSNYDYSSGTGDGRLVLTVDDKYYE